MGNLVIGKNPLDGVRDRLLCEDGTRVMDARTWQAKRRGEILRSYSTQMYGRTPELPSKVSAEVMK